MYDTVNMAEPLQEFTHADSAHVMNADLAPGSNQLLDQVNQIGRDVSLLPSAPTISIVITQPAEGGKWVDPGTAVRIAAYAICPRLIVICTQLPVVRSEPGICL